MAVTSVEELAPRSLTYDGGLRYQRRFRVQSNSLADGPATVALAAGIPRRGNSLSTPDITAINTVVHSVGAELEDDAVSRFVWIVTATYGPFGLDLQNPGDDPSDPANPTLDPPQIERTFVESTIPVFWAYEGSGEGRRVDAATPIVPMPDSELDLTADPKFKVRIQNSAKEAFDPPNEATIYDLVITITRNETEISTATMKRFTNAVNTTAWQGNPPGTCLMVVTATNEFSDAGIEYDRVTYVVMVRDDGWDINDVDEGYMAFGSGSEEERKIKAAVDSDGQLLSSPKLLDGFGDFLGPDVDHWFVMQYQIRKRAEFNELNLPTA